MNPVALGMVAIGALLLALGLLLVTKRRKATGIAISLLGLGTAVAPFAITFFLFR
jgi:LPXTG-motif cell wall-anchored protein